MEAKNFKFQNTNNIPTLECDKNIDIKIEDNQCLTSIDKNVGYKTCVFNAGIKKGNMYFEATLDNEIGHCRIGFATDNCEILGPLGYDSNGFSYGSRHGYSFNKSIRRTYGKPYRHNDTVSCIIMLNKTESSIKFYLNGHDMGKAFDVKYGQTYYPAISLYDGCRVSLNFTQYAIYDTLIFK